MHENEPTVDSIDLLRRLNGGDRTALNQLLERFRARLLARIRLMMGDRARALAESTDFLQATFVTVVERIDAVELRDDVALLRWMTWIARNRIRESVRRDHEHRLDGLSGSLSGRTLAIATREGPSTQIASAEELMRLAEALESLPDDLRQVVILHDLEGKTFAATGEHLGINADGARWRHRKALLQLGRVLGKSSD